MPRYYVKQWINGVDYYATGNGITMSENQRDAFVFEECFELDFLRFVDPKKTAKSWAKAHAELIGDNARVVKISGKDRGE